MFQRNGIDYTEAPNSRSRTVEVLTVILQTRKNSGWNLLNSWRDGEFCAPIPDDPAVGGWLDLESSSSQPAEAYDTVTMVLKVKKPRIFWRTADRTDPVYVPASTPLELPLERAPNYRAKWNNDLYLLTPEGDPPAAAPNQWETATTPGTFTDNGFTWAIAESSPGDGWELFIYRTKPGQQAFIWYSYTMTETLYFRSLSRAVSAQKLSGTLAAPGYAGPFEKDPEKWLVQSSAVQESGEDLFALNSVYLYAPDGWDTDTYTPNNRKEQENA